MVEIEGINFSEDAYYEGYGSYLLAKVVEGTVRVKITEFGQKIMKDVVYVELPSIGEEVKQGEAFGVMETIKATGELTAPVSGEVIEVNEDASEDPRILGEKQGKNWLIVIKPSNLDAELRNLMDVEGAKAYYTEEIRKARAEGLLK